MRRRYRLVPEERVYEVGFGLISIVRLWIWAINRTHKMVLPGAPPHPKASGIIDYPVNVQEMPFAQKKYLNVREGKVA